MQSNPSFAIIFELIVGSALKGTILYIDTLKSLNWGNQ